MKFYIAGPFFNVFEQAVIESVENTIREANHTYFSPRGMGVADMNNPVDRRVIFDQNFQELEQCDAVIAWTERLQAEESLSLRIVRETKPPADTVECGVCGFIMPPDEPEPEDEHCPKCHSYQWQFSAASAYVIEKEVRIPDTGTMWEAGAAYALKRPVILFSNDPDGIINLMLQEGALGCVYGMEHLKKFIRAPIYTWQEVLTQWQGGHDEDAEHTEPTDGRCDEA